MVKKIIESYQVGRSEIFGDILSKHPPKRKPKVGLLAYGYFEYWRMFENLEKEVEADMNRIAGYMAESNKYELVYPGFIDTMDKADEAGENLREADIDLIVLTEGTYFPDYMCIQSIRHVEHVPLVLYIPQSFSKIRLDIRYRDIVESSGFVGLCQLAGSFAKMGWERNVVMGPIDDQSVYKEIEEYAQVCGVIRRLKNLKVGAYGHPFRGMFDIEYDKTKLLGNIGPETIYIEERQLAQALANVKEEDVNNLFAETKRRFRIEDVSDITINKGCRTAIALRKLVEDFRLDVLSLLSQYNIQLLADDTGGYGSSLLIENGFMVSCEGDVATLVMMDVLYQFAGISPMYGEYTLYDLEKNAFVFSHHGDGDPNLAESMDKVVLTSCPETWGCREALAFEFTMRPGRATICGIIDDAIGQKMLIGSGESLGGEPFHIHSPQVFFRPDIPVLTFLKSIVESGFRHHAVIALGDYKNHLIKLAKMLNIRTMTL